MKVLSMNCMRDGKAGSEMGVNGTEMKTYEELVKILENNGELRNENGVDFIYKKSPDTEEGYLDRREAAKANAVQADMERNPENYPQNLFDNMDKLFPAPPASDSIVFKGIPVGFMRQSMGWNNIDRSKGIEVRKERLDGTHGEVEFYIYSPSGRVHGEGRRPCLIYIHGGGFMAGTPSVVENPCKAIAELADAVVLSVDYRLAPEHPFPEGFDDCYDVVKWAFVHDTELGINQKKIGVAGDSAGGNLAAVCALRDRDEGTGMIHYQALLYAALICGEDREYPGYHWSPDIYLNKADDSYIVNAYSWIKESAPTLVTTYVQDADVRNPYVSPMAAASFSGLPKTLIATAEYDFLRAECDLYAGYLREAGVAVRDIRYGGVTHAFLDKYGFFPQAEDCVKEIAKDLKSL